MILSSSGGKVSLIAHPDHTMVLHRNTHTHTQNLYRLTPTLNFLLLFSSSESASHIILIVLAVTVVVVTTIAFIFYR